MRSRVAAVGLSFALALVPVLQGRQEEPCQKEWEGQRLADSLYNVDLMVKLLGRLRGSEDPKLKALLELNLQFAARDAVDAIGHGAELASPYVAVNFLHGVQKGEQYVAAHQMDVASAPPGNATPKPVGENLATLDAWLEKRK
jgi:hypothetical protein